MSVHFADAQPVERIAIFVGPQTRDGFVDIDRGVLDSVKDLRNELEGDKRFRLVPKREQVRLVLEVLSRGATSTNGGGAVGVPIGTMTFVLPVGTIGIATLLHVGTYEKPIVFQNCGSWGHCAKLVAQDLDTWMDANAVTLAGLEPKGSDCPMADGLQALPGDTLAAKIRVMHPGSYGNLDDARLESLFLTSFPCLRR